MPVEYSPSITSARIIPSLLRCPPERGKINLAVAGANVSDYKLFEVALDAMSVERPAARPPIPAQRVCRLSAHPARGRWRKPWHGPPLQVQHHQDSIPFPVPPRLHALRPDPQHARAQAQAPRRAIRRDTATITGDNRNLLYPLK